MFDDSKSKVSAKGLRVATVVSSYHKDITVQLESGARSYFLEMGGLEKDYTSIDAVGSWELPVITSQVIETQDFDCIVVLGCIISGETTHDKVIGYSISQGLMDLSISWGRPIAMGVLTCQSLEQAMDRANGKRGNKGQEAMYAAIQTAQTIRSLNS